MKTDAKEGYLPFLHVEADSIPEAHYKLLRAVDEGGMSLRTEYDRKDDSGKYIDPPGKDAKVAVRVENPFAQPRFAPFSYCERGKYIAEFLGAKNHLVVPYEQLLAMIQEGQEFSAKQWPYCYNQRLTEYPLGNGKTLDQLEIILDKLARDPITRRAVAITPVPQVDLFMKEDQPCLREIGLRAMEGDEKKLILHMDALWRSRDLYKAWADNMIGISNLHRTLAERLAEKTGREVVVGPYTEQNISLHIYGQDYSEKGANTMFEAFPTVEDYVANSMDSDSARFITLMELQTLKGESTWNFGPKQIAIIDRLINDFESGRVVP
jgi:thymidylate synthase